MRIIAYTYDADWHCPDCAREAAALGLLRREPPLQLGTDEHGLAYDLVDKENNPIHPVFSTDETPADLAPEYGGYDVYCSDCGAAIAVQGGE